MNLHISPTTIKGLLVVEPKIIIDPRGYFMESYNRSAYSQFGIDVEFVQDNQSLSLKCKTLRGLHFQKNYPQAKLVRVVSGRVFDVAVDLRKASPTFGCYYSIILDTINHKQLYIPVGFAHGFLVLDNNTIFSYKCSNFYYPEDEAGLIWSDPQVYIPWPMYNPIVSDKDKKLPKLSELEFTF